MDPGNLRKSLTKLHEELGRARQVDPDSRKLLVQLLSDIERLVHGPAAAAPSTPDTAHRHRLKELEVKFEADHPALATTLREFIDALAKMGL
jgi:hypothetical protein